MKKHDEEMFLGLTHQEKTWKGNFGKDYTLRNLYENKELDELFKRQLGITRTEMNEKFIGNLNRDIKILEVGANVGLMLVSLQLMGFKNLYGIELQEHAVQLAKERTNGINIIQGTAYELPYEDNSFDLIFTTRVLIHINPDKLKKALGEIVRCTREWVYGCEYFSEELVEIPRYEGYENILFKWNYAKQYLDNFKNLELVKEEKYKYTYDNNVDQTFLLRKIK